MNSMTLPEYIEIRSDVMMGKPCIQGTRIPVYLVLEKLAAGETIEQLVESYPQLKPVHVRAALKYAAMLASEENVLVS